MNDTVRLALDAEKCIGVGQCELLEGDVFQLDDDEGVAVIVGEPVLPAARAAVIVERCPSQAITISPESSDG